jgi:hypothetical protein
MLVHKQIGRLALLALALGWTSTAFGQGAILQAGPRTGGHAPMYTGTGSGGQTTVQDSGPAGGGAAGLGLSELLLVKRGTGTPPYANQGTGPLNTTNCMYDAPITNAGGYHYLCFDPNAQGGGLLAYGAGGGAATLPFNFIINGDSGITPGVSSINGRTGALILGDLTVTATGATSAISEKNRAARQIYVTDFGAICDGATDDAAAINNAISAVATLGGIVNIPASICAVASSVNLVQGVTLNGQGPIIDQLGFTQPATTVSKLKWIGGATGAMISTPAALNSNVGIANLTIDGRVAFGSLGTSALKGIKIGSGFGAKIDRVTIANVGKGISFEPGYGVATPPLISWGDYRNITMTLVGTGMDFAPNTTIGMTNGGVTNNNFYNVIVYQPVNFGLNFWALSDNNHFHGVFLDTATVGATLIAFNTLDPTNPVGVYANSMSNAEISCNDTGSGAGIHPLVVNNTNAFGTYIQGQFFNCEAPTVNTGGIVTVIDDANPNYVMKSWKPLNGFAGVSYQNPNAGNAATSGIEFGNNAGSGLAHIVLNSSTNAGYAGVNSLNIYSDNAFPIGFGVNGTLMGKFTTTGFVSSGTLTLATAIGNANGTNPVCFNSGTGAVTYATSACTASDARLKTKIAPLADVSAKLFGLQAWRYTWKDPVYGTAPQVGVIADEFEEAFPELVSIDGTGLRAFDYQKFTAVLFEAMKEQQAQIDDLKTKVH